MDNKQVSMMSMTVRRMYGRDLVKVPNKPFWKNFKPLAGFFRVLRDTRAYLDEHPFIATTLKATGVISTLAVVLFVILTYNAYVNFKNQCNKYYAQLGVEVLRRENLIPNLIALAGNYSEHEKGIMEHVSSARQMLASSGSVNERLNAAKELETALSKILAVMEQYPDLKATEPTKLVIDQMTDTENRIAEMKLKYNEYAKQYNDLWFDIPTSFIAIYFFGVTTPLPYIATDEEIMKVPLVKFEELQLAKEPEKEAVKK